MCTGFSLRLLQSTLPVDGNDAAMYTVRSVDNVASTSAAIADAEKTAVGKKRANSGKMKSKSKRVAAEESDAGASEVDDAIDTEVVPTDCIPSPPRHQTQKPRVGASKAVIDDALPPSPYKPGELHSPEHKRARVARDGTEAPAPLSSLQANALTGRVARKPVVTASDAENIVSAGGKRARGARSATTAKETV
jgi:hypothetical protein